MINSKNGWTKALTTIIVKKQQTLRQYQYLQSFIILFQSFAFLAFILSLSASSVNQIHALIINILKKSLQDYRFPVIILTVVNLSCFCIVFLTTWIQKMSFERSSSILNISININKLKKISAISYILLQLLLLPSITITIIVLNGQNLSTFIFITTAAISQLILLFLISLLETKNLLYEYRLTPIFILSLIIDPIVTQLFILLLSLLQLRKQENTFKQLIYIELFWLNVVMIAQNIWKIEIDNTHFIFISVCIAAVVFFLPANISIINETAANDYLLSWIKKLVNQQKLNKNEHKLLMRILYKFQDRCRQNKNNQLHIALMDIKRRMQLSWTEKQLIQFLQLKLTVDLSEDSSNILLKIQSIHCLLMNNKFTIQIFYDIQKLSSDFGEQPTFEQKIRIQNLLQEITDNFMPNEETVNGDQILNVEQQVQKIYSNASEMIEIALLFWITIATKRSQEHDIYKKLIRMYELQDQNSDIITRLKPLRNMAIQLEVNLYLSRLINFHTTSDHSQKTGQLINFSDKTVNHTSFIHVTNQRITDISNQITEELKSKKEDIIGQYFQVILADSYRKYFHNNMSQIMKNYQQQMEVMIPLKIIGQKQDYILPCSGKFSILPNITCGIQYIIHIHQHQQFKQYPSFLYRAKNDQITQFSQNFLSCMSLNKSKVNHPLLASQVFKIDLSSIVGSKDICKGLIINCELMIRQINQNQKRRSNDNSSVTLKVIEYFTINEQKVVLIQARRKGQRKSLSNSSNTLTNFLIDKEKSISENQKSITYRKYQASQNITFCKIPNPYQNLIDQKMSKLNHLHRLTYGKVIWILVIIAVCLFINLFILLLVNNESTGINLQQCIDININKNKLIQQIYLMYYQSYQYYQIKNYPEQFTSIGPYDMIKEEQEYYKKADFNINSLLQYQFDQKINQQTLIYQLLYDNFHRIQQTNSNSMLPILQNAKQSLKQNNPYFMVDNQHAIQTIIQSYKPISLDLIDNITQLQLTLMISTFIAMLLIIGCIKLIVVKIRMTVWEIFELFDKISQADIVKIQKRLIEFKMVLLESHLYTSHQNQRYGIYFNQEERYRLRTCSTHQTLQKQMKQLTKATLITQNRIKKDHVSTFISKRNTVFIVPFLILLYLCFYYLQIKNYKQGSHQIIKYSENLQSAISMVIQRSQTFFQVAMEEVLPAQKRKGWIRQIERYIPTDFESQLPSFFKNYRRFQKQNLGMNLCSYADLNKGSLYKYINCSKVLNKIMQNGYYHTYSLYLDIIQQFGGIQMKDFGKYIRTDATYPAFMQICYTRRIMYNMLVFLQNQFNVQLKAYIISSSQYMKFIIQIGVILLLIILIIFVIYIRQIKRLCNFAVKLFLVLPRSFLVRITTMRLLKENNILDKVEWLHL